MKKIITIVISIIIASTLNAQTVLQTKSISIFNDGKSFVIKEGTVDTKENQYTIEEMPNALMGTFWFTGRNSRIKQVVSSLQEVDKPIERKANSFSDLLYANKGKEITITTTDDKTYRGIVEDFDLPETINSLLRIKEAELSKYQIAGGSLNIFPTTQVFSFKMADKWISLSPMDIRAIEFTSKPNYNVNSSIKVKKPVINVEFTSGKKQGLNMMYLQNGISWTPTYLLTLLTDTQANLTLQAEVINDVEDIKDTEINFVVGVPNFRFANQPATLNTWTQFVQGITTMLGVNNRAMVATRTMADAAYEMAAPEFNPTNEAQENEGLYLYTIKNAGLEKGSRAHHTLFESKIKIKHQYECILPNSNHRISFHDGASYTFDARYNNVYHSIEITNDTKNPFTQGSVMIVNGANGKPIAQDQLRYTGTGMTTSIKLTQFQDVRVENKENVKTISNDFTRINNINYRLVTVDGEITITNSQKKDLNFSISKAIVGKLNSVSEKHTKNSNVMSHDINPLESFNIKMLLKGNETKKINYTYQIHVR